MTTPAADLAAAYVRAHFSARTLRAAATDDDGRLALAERVAAYLGDHYLLDDVAYADLCDVATDAVAGGISRQAWA